MNRPQTQPAKLGPLPAVLGLLLAAWFSVTQTASAVCLPQDHSDLFAASTSPAEHQETNALPPENRVWGNFGSSNEITPADELNSLQLRWESHFGELEFASGVLSYADGNPISLSDPFGLCASRNACTGGYATGNGQSTMPPAIERFVGSVLDVANEMVYGDEDWRSGKYVSFDMGVASLFSPIGELGSLAKLGAAAKGVSNSVPSTMARIVDARFVNSPGLGGPGAADVFVTAASDIRGITTSQGLANRLTLLDNAGNLRQGPFGVIEFSTPASGIASPVFRSNPGFIQGGLTGGGAREFVLPNMQVNQLQNVNTRIIP